MKIILLVCFQYNVYGYVIMAKVFVASGGQCNSQPYWTINLTFT